MPEYYYGKWLHSKKTQLKKGLKQSRRVKTIIIRKMNCPWTGTEG